LCVPRPYADRRASHPFPTRRSSDLALLRSSQLRSILANRFRCCLAPLRSEVYWRHPIGSHLRHCHCDCHYHWFQGNSLCRLCLRSEEHTSELQSRENLVCRLLLEKK